MSNLFNHTVQPLGSTTSPVEDLALEVSDAFEKLSGAIDTSNTTIDSFKDVIGNPLFEDLKQHKVVSQFSESHTMLESESDIVLENIPYSDDISVTFNDSTGSTIPLKLIQNNQDFTDKNQFKIFGKVLKLNIVVPTGKSVTINVVYRAESFALDDKKVLSNVLKKLDNTYLLNPVKKTSTTYEIDYGFDITNNFNKYVLGNNSFLFYSTQDGTTYSKVNVSEYTIDKNVIKFTAENLNLDNNTRVLVFINNTTISSLLNALYKEFIEHDHSNNNIAKNIDHKDLVNKYTNTDKIQYKTGDVPNYDHPQYLNREGFNPNIDGVYENSMLGDLFISRLLTNVIDKYKGLDENSNKLIFGEPILGPSLQYNKKEEALTLSTVSAINGLSILIPSIEKYLLKLNQTKIKSNPQDKLKIYPEGDVFEVTSLTGTSLSKFQNLSTSLTGTFNNIVTNTFKINNVLFSKDADNLSLSIDSVIPTDPNQIPYLKINTPIKAKFLDVNEVNFTTINTKKIDMGKVNLITQDNSDVVIKSEDATAKVIFENDTIFNKITVTELIPALIKPTTIKIGDVVLAVNSDTINKGLEVWSTKATSDIRFNTKTYIEEGEIANLIANNSDLKKAIVAQLEMGKVELSKNTDGNLVIKNLDTASKVIFESPVEFLNVTSTTASKVSLDNVDSAAIRFGKHVIKKGEDGELIIEQLVPTDDTTFQVKSKMYVDNFYPKNIHGENSTGLLNELTINKLHIADTTFQANSGNIYISPKNAESNTINIDTITKIKTLIATQLQVTGGTVLTNSVIDSIKMGDIVFSKTDENNVVISTSIIDKKLTFGLPVEMLSTLIEKLTFNIGKSNKLVSKNISIGNISLEVDENNGDLIFNRSDINSVIRLLSPAVAENLEVKDLKVENTVKLNNLVAENVSINGFNITKEEGSDNIELNNGTTGVNLFSIKVPMLASQLTAKIFSSENYTLINKDKISIDSDNYLMNNGSKFDFVSNKAINFSGSSRDSGLRFNLGLDTSASYKQYLSANSGTKAVDAEKNMFIELDVNDGLYFLTPTNKKISKNNILYGFNDTTSQRVISDLRKWFRANIFAGKIEGTSLNVSVSEQGSKNGITIGETRLSVIGPNTDCPIGLTLLESGDGIHFVKPLSNENEGCNNLSYQELNVGSVYTKGDVAIDGTASITEDLVVNNTVAASSLNASGDSEMNNLDLAGALSVAGKASFLSPVVFRNSLELTNDIISTGNIEAKSITANYNSEFLRDVKIAGNLQIDKNIDLQGGLSLRSGLTSAGVLKSKGVETESISTQTINTLGDVSVSGTTTLQGKLEVKSSSAIQGSLSISNNLNVSDTVTTQHLYAIKDVSVTGKLSSSGGVDFQGRSISIGSENSVVQLNGRLQFNTQDVTFNSAVKIFNSLKVTDNVEVFGKLSNKGGIEIESTLYAKGYIKTDSTVESSSSIIGKTLEIDQNITAGNSIISNNVTTESLAVSSVANIANLTIAQSLSMPNDTSIMVGTVKASQFTQTDPEMVSSFAGSLAIAKDTDLLGSVNIGRNLRFNDTALVVNSNGLIGRDAVVDVDTVQVNEIRGKESIQPPSALSDSKSNSAKTVSSLIAQRKFARIDHFVCEGISVFTQPIVADTIFYNNLVFVGNSEDTRTGAVNILAKRALYAL